MSDISIHLIAYLTKIQKYPVRESMMKQLGLLLHFDKLKFDRLIDVSCTCFSLFSVLWNKSRLWWNSRAIWRQGWFLFSSWRLLQLRFVLAHHRHYLLLFLGIVYTPQLGIASKFVVIMLAVMFFYAPLWLYIWQYRWECERKSIHVFLF